MDFVVDGNGVIVYGNIKGVELITVKVAVVISASSGHTLADSRGVVVKVLETLERNISANLGRNEDLGERIHLGESLEKGLENKLYQDTHLTIKPPLNFNFFS